MKKHVTYPICLECNQHQRSCCQFARVPLTIKDIATISRLGYALDFFAYPGKYPKSWLINNEIWWQESMTKIGNTKLKINTKTNLEGYCVFLKQEKGCCLGKNRPSVCKIYPFWVNEKNEIIFEEGEEEFCFIGQKDFSPKDGWIHTGENEGSIREHFQAIKDDCINNRDAHEILIRELLEISSNKS